MQRLPQTSLAALSPLLCEPPSCCAESAFRFRVFAALLTTASRHERLDRGKVPALPIRLDTAKILGLPIRRQFAPTFQQ